MKKTRVNPEDVFNSMGEALLTTDLSGNITRMNMIAETLTGYRSAEVIGKAFSAILGVVNLLNGERYGNLPEQVIREGTVTWQGGNTGMVVMDHSTIPIDGSMAPVIDSRGFTGGVVMVFHDVSEQKNSKEKLLASEKRWQTMVEQTDDAIALISGDGYILFESPAVTRILGYTPEELVGRIVLDLICPEDTKSALEEFQRILSLPGKTIHTQTRFVHKDGHYVWIEAAITNRLDDPDLRAIISDYRDITERKRAEEKLRESEERFHSLFELSQAVMLIIEPDSGSIVDANQAAVQFYGYSHAQLISKKISDINQLNPDEVATERMRALNRQKNYFVFPHRLANGEIRIVEVRSSGIVLKNQALLFSIIFDITERKQAEEKLLESEEFLKESQEMANMGSWRLDLMKNKSDWSENFYRLYGYIPFEVEPSFELFLNAVHPDDRHIVNEDFQNLLHHPKSLIHEFRILDRNGRMRWINNSMSPKVENGKVVRLTGTQIDITERKIAVEKLHDSNEKNRGLIESIGSVVVSIDWEGTVLYLNDIAARQAGGNAMDFTGKKIFEIFPAEYAIQAMKIIQQVIIQDHAIVREVQTLVQNRLRWYRTSYQPIHDETGRVTQVLVNANDIDDLKTIQKELSELNSSLEDRIRQATEEIQDLYDNSPVGYHSLDERGNILLINQTELNWLGYKRDELIGKPYYNLFTPESLATFRSIFPVFLEHGWIRDLEFEIIRKDGTIFPVSVNATAIKNKDGNFVMSRSTVSDITSQKRAEAALRKNEERMELAFRAAQDGIWDWNMETDEIYFSSGYSRMLGYEESEIEHQISSWKRLLHPDDMERSLQVVKDVLHGKREFVMEFRMLHKDGHYVDILSRGFPVRRKPDGPIVRIVGTHMDLTERKNVEETLKLANLELKHAIRVKDEFLTNMSHELRTPLNAILGQSEIMAGQFFGTLNERQLRSVKTIDKSGRHLLELITDILDLSKLEVKLLTLDLSSIVVADVCEASLPFVREMAHKKSIRLTSKVDPEADVIRADGRRLRQMLINLLSNAVKFTPERGTVELHVSADPIHRTLSFSVTDTGIGIAPENIGRLFHPFVQLDSGLDRQYEGSGLGLALVDRMAKLHGGSVTVQSEPGKGSRFTIVLPWTGSKQASPIEASPSDEQAAFGPDRPVGDNAPLVLIAEDHEDNAEMLSDFLSLAGYRTTTARNGKEALDLIRRLRPSMVLMDLQMPVMDGLEAMRRLRLDADPQLAAVPVIALTALAMPGDRERSLEAGADEYMSKPFSLKLLDKTIKKHIGEK